MGMRLLSALTLRIPGLELFRGEARPSGWAPKPTGLSCCPKLLLGGPQRFRELVFANFVFAKIEFR